ncbi:hypothetical protein WN51_04125 [Melipona quadrifasciata]|uniref:Uncharacterized protein n=1 Tax=Melipona quadrifasciata TaxID=166423 RepID=A0A0M8ZSI9_9HYME|nr:hypothetical protein WN51_04125 [Melipona quadrifasciata]
MRTLCIRSSVHRGELGVEEGKQTDEKGKNKCANVRRDRKRKRRREREIRANQRKGDNPAK